MDIHQKVATKKTVLRRLGYTAIALAGVTIAMARLSHMRTDTTVVDLASIWSDTVKRGRMNGVVVTVDLRKSAYSIP